MPNTLRQPRRRPGIPQNRTQASVAPAAVYHPHSACFGIHLRRGGRRGRDREGGGLGSCAADGYRRWRKAARSWITRRRRGHGAGQRDRSTEST